MNRLAKSLLGMVVLCGACAAPLCAEEKVDNPEYKHWAQFKPGSFSCLKNVVTTMGMKSETTMTTTLKEVTAEKVVVEVEVVTVVAGQTMKVPPEKREIPAKIETVKAQEQIEPKGKIKEGKEKIEVAGKKIETKWVETELKQDKMVVKSKVWSSDDVPGQVVKIVMSTDGDVKSQTEGSVVKFKADKK